MTPGRKFSTTISAEATSRRTASTASGDLRLSAMLFLPALSWPKLVLARLRNGGRVRIMSPSGASILITSAPRSASIRPQWGPAIVVVKSSTRRPTNAGPHPGVVVIHHMPGWDEWTCEVARKFAHHGYAAIAPSLYFRVGDGADEAVVAKVREAGGVPDEQMLGEVTGAIDFLRSQPHASSKVGVIGFCPGGRQTYLVACKLSHLVQAAVDCWGGNVVVDDKSRLTAKQPVAPIDLTEGINCPLLGLFGNEDT